MGAIFVQLLIGYPIFAGESNIEQISRIVGRLGNPSMQVEQEVIYFKGIHWAKIAHITIL